MTNKIEINKAIFENLYKQEMKTAMDLSNGIPESGLTVLCEGQLTRLFFDHATQTTQGEEGEQTLITCECVDVKGARTYDNFVSAIVDSRYTSDDTLAILANKALADDTQSNITDEKRTEYAEQYAEFQAWRAHAKDIAKQALAELKKK